MSNLIAEALAVRALALDLGEDELELSIQSETGFLEAIELVLSAIRETETLAEAIAKRMSDLDARQARLRNRAQRLRDVLTSALEMAGQRTLRLPEATISLAEGAPRVVILEEERIPDRYWRTVTERKLDRAALLADLKEGHVDGATLDNIRPRLTVRTK